MAKNDMDDFSYIGRTDDRSSSWDYFGEGDNSSNDGKNGKEKKYIGGLIASLCALWIPSILVIFILLVMSDGAVGKGMDPVINTLIIVILAMCIGFSLLIFVFWKKHTKIRNLYASKLTDYDWNLPKNKFTKVLPISFDGQIIRMNRILKMEEINVQNVLWLSFYYASGQYGTKQFCATLHDNKGGKYSIATSGKKNNQSAHAIINNIKSANPEMLFSEGFWSKETRQCKKKYKEMIMNGGR